MRKDRDLFFCWAVTEVTGPRQQETNIHPAAPLLKVEADDVRRGGVYSFITIHSGGGHKQFGHCCPPPQICVY